MAVTWSTRPQPGTPLDGTLRGVVVAFRILSWLWMTLLVAFTLVSDPGADTAIVIGAEVLATVWAGFTVFIGWRTDELGSLWFVVSDGVVVFFIGAASTVSGAENLFHGGYLLSWLMVAAYAYGLAATLVAAGVLTVEQVVVHIVDDRSLVPTVGSVSFFVFGLVVGATFDALRIYDRRRRDAEAALLQQKSEAARWEERFVLADELHDSVLQTLHAIRLSAEQPNEVRHLARSQERLLRRTIAEMRSRFDDSFAAALLGARDDVEDLYPVQIEPVIRHDAELTDELRCVVDATREAMMNAAAHGSTDKIDLYAEITDDTLTVHVRDRGTGFAPSALDPGRGFGRHIIKVEDAGGAVAVSSTPGEGTEVTITMALP